MWSMWRIGRRSGVMGLLGLLRMRVVSIPAAVRVSSQMSLLRINWRCELASSSATTTNPR
jgi:hypothetical protein